MKTVVKKWFREKNYGFLDNGSGPDIMVRKADLVGCQYLKIGATVEFECHPEKRGLVARNVRLSHRRGDNRQINGNCGDNKSPFGVMT